MSVPGPLQPPPGMTPPTAPPPRAKGWGSPPAIAPAPRPVTPTPPPPKPPVGGGGGINFSAVLPPGLGIPELKAPPGVNIGFGADGRFGADVDLAKRFPAGTSPLTAMTGGLGGAKPYVDAGLNFVSRNLASDPATFATAMGAIPGVRDLTKGLLGSGLGVAALPALYGLIGGGRAGADAYTFARPLLGKFLDLPPGIRVAPVPGPTPAPRG